MAHFTFLAQLGAGVGIPQGRYARNAASVHFRNGCVRANNYCWMALTTTPTPSTFLNEQTSSCFLRGRDSGIQGSDRGNSGGSWPFGGRVLNATIKVRHKAAWRGLGVFRNDKLRCRGLV